jgi:hypothetical protein
MRPTFKLVESKYCVDSAFCSATNPFMIKSSENVLHAQTLEEVLVQQEATSLHQAAEWGMHAIQSSFPRLKD